MCYRNERLYNNGTPPLFFQIGYTPFLPPKFYKKYKKNQYCTEIELPNHDKLRVNKGNVINIWLNRLIYRVKIKVYFCL